MVKGWIVSALGIGAVLCATAAAAHHSIGNVYDDTQRVTIEGVITRFQFVNPHPLVVVEVSSPNDKAGQWMLEMDNRIGSIKDAKVTTFIPETAAEPSQENVAADGAGNVYGSLTGGMALRKYVRN